MRETLKTILPAPLLNWYRQRRAELENAKNRGRSPSEVFSEIYRQGKWGAKGSSGSGSVESQIVQPYVTAISAYLKSRVDEGLVVVDLGCGDFNIGRNFLDLCRTYIAVDVVDELIEDHKQKYPPEKVRFCVLDIVDQELPDGDICFLRQVLQHLSNAQIAKILPKLSRYSAVFVTEHYPSSLTGVVPNKDKVQGAAIRLFERSAVYLDQPPFNIPTYAITTFLEVPGHSFGGGGDSGVIRTLKIDPARM